MDMERGVNMDMPRGNWGEMAPNQHIIYVLKKRKTKQKKINI